MLHPPQWDEEFERGRLRRKLLEGAELELTQLSIDTGKDIAQTDKIGISLILKFPNLAFEPNVMRGESEIARLLSAIWPRTGLF